MSTAGVPVVPESLVALLEDSASRGFLGPGPVAAHIEHALGYADAYEAATATNRDSDLVPGHVLDLGSGGGIPGLVLAWRWPGATFTLLDSNERRTSWLTDAVSVQGWTDRVDVARGRAEELGHSAYLRCHYDAVVARSFGPPAAVAECGSPFLKVGGLLIVSEPPGESDDDGRLEVGDPGSRWPADGLAKLKLAPEARWLGKSRYAVHRQESPCPERYPRRVGVPMKRLLFA